MGENQSRTEQLPSEVVARLYAIFTTGNRLEQGELGKMLPRELSMDEVQDLHFHIQNLAEADFPGKYSQYIGYKAAAHVLIDICYTAIEEDDIVTANNLLQYSKAIKFAVASVVNPPQFMPLVPNPIMYDPRYN